MAGRTFVSKQAPIEPEWHKKLLPIAKLAGKSGTSVASPEALAFKNMCRRLVATKVLISWELETDSTTKTSIFWVNWTARDAQWSGRV